jgi:hypothetical protein
MKKKVARPAHIRGLARYRKLLEELYSIDPELVRLWGERIKWQIAWQKRLAFLDSEAARRAAAGGAT